MGHRSNRTVQAAHTSKCPQGTNTWVTLFSKHTLHVSFSVSLASWVASVKDNDMPEVDDDETEEEDDEEDDEDDEAKDEDSEDAGRV